MTAIGAHIPRAARPRTSIYPFRKVHIINSTASTTFVGFLVEGDPRIERELASGAHIERRWEVLGPRRTRELPLSDEGARLEAAVRIRARAAAAREAIAVRAEVTAQMREIRRQLAQDRRDEQRKVRIYTGTDRATIRARRAVIATPARPGRITALNRFFGR